MYIEEASFISPSQSCSFRSAQHTSTAFGLAASSRNHIGGAGKSKRCFSMSAKYRNRFLLIAHNRIVNSYKHYTLVKQEMYHQNVAPLTSFHFMLIYHTKEWVHQNISNINCFIHGPCFNIFICMPHLCK